VTTSSKRRSAPSRFLGKLLFDDFIVPTRRLFVLLAAGAVLTVLGFVVHLGSYVFWGYNALLLVLSLIDYWLLPRRKVWSVHRELPNQVEVNQPFDVVLELRVSSPQHVELEMVDDLPLAFEGAWRSVDSASLSSRMDDDYVNSRLVVSGVMDGTYGQFTYTTRALERGQYAWRFVDLRYSGGLKLWKKQVRLEYPGEVEVYPDLSQVRGVLGSVQDALILEGSRLYKKQKSGSDFHYIRDYAQGDDPRHINWKASARSAKLMTNLFQPEKGKIVTLLLDCGRMMGIELEGQVKLDRTLEAALTLAAVALRQGDQVALLAYSAQVKVYVPPGKGLHHLQEITRAVYDLKCDFVESSYATALNYLLRFQKKRSLVVIFSEMESYLYDRELLSYLGRLRKNNHLLLLSLQDPVLHGWGRIQAHNSRSAFIQSMAHKFITDRKSYVNNMAGMSIPVLDVPADQLALSAVNAYLDLKSRDAL
jgi:uncharacterized protein (DUF58 family)